MATNLQNNTIEVNNSTVELDASDVLEPTQIGAHCWIEPNMIQGRNITPTIANGTALGGTTKPIDLSGRGHDFSLANAANRPLFKTTEGFNTIEGIDTSDTLEAVNITTFSVSSILFTVRMKLTTTNSNTRFILMNDIAIFSGDAVLVRIKNKHRNFRNRNYQLF